ncbi:MAG: CopD family protein [Kofleriaceae bacterium]
MTDHLVDGVLVRSAVILALSIALGPRLWALAIGGSRGGAAALGRGRRLAAWILLAGAGGLAVIGAMLAFAERWSLDDALAVVGGTSYGHALVVHLAACAAFGGLIARADRAGAVGAPLVGLAVLGTLARLGHAALQSGAQLAIQVAHTAAVVGWLGLLSALVEQLARRPPSAAEVRRLSRVALALVIAIAVTGAVRALSLASGEGSAPTWVATLGIKLVGFAGALAIAVAHRRSGFHGLARGAPDWRRFQAFATLELWLVVCVVLMAALLSQVPPP